MMCIFNLLFLSIELRVIGYIIEQIEMIQFILDNGYGYVQNGFVYFDILKFVEEKKVYGNLLGCVIDDLMVEFRFDLKNQGEKKYFFDFVLWMKVFLEYIM